MLSKAEREELKALSLEVFGVSSRYTKLMEADELVTEEVEEEVPGEDGAEATKRTVRRPKLTLSGARQFQRITRNFEETKAKLLEFKGKLDQMRAQISKQNEENRLKQEAEAAAKKLNEELAGSAI